MKEVCPLDKKIEFLKVIVSVVTYSVTVLYKQFLTKVEKS